ERASTHLVVAVGPRRDERMMHVREGALTRMVLQEVPEPQELCATTPAPHVRAVRVERDQPPRSQPHGVPAAMVGTGPAAEVREVAERSVAAVVLMVPRHGVAPRTLPAPALVIGTTERAQPSGVVLLVAQRQDRIGVDRLD